MRKPVMVLFIIALCVFLTACVPMNTVTHVPLISNTPATSQSANTAPVGTAPAPSAAPSPSVPPPPSAAPSPSVVLSPSAVPSPTVVPSPSAAPSKVLPPTVEDKIKSALVNKTSYAFMIAKDYHFASASGYKTNKDKNGTTTSKQTKQWAQNDLKSHSSGYIVRIDSGKATMVDSTNYKCALKVLDGGGISLTIKHVPDQSISAQISGVINGDVLTASAETKTAYYFVFTKSGYGTYCSGQYSVNLAGVNFKKIPPTPVVLKTAVNTDKSITLKWTDINPSGSAAYYKIYRQIGANAYTVATTVKNKKAWTDDSIGVKENLFRTVTYYIVAYNGAGLSSPPSNYQICVGPIG